MYSFPEFPGMSGMEGRSSWSESEDEYEDMNEVSLVAEASLHPPVHDDDKAEDAAPLPSSVLMDYEAYLEERTNGSTAWSRTRYGHRIRVTFWAAQPPRVSYFTVWCPDVKPGEFDREPFIMAAEDDLVLLAVALRTPEAQCGEGKYDLFIYRAAGAGRQPPSMERINHPGPSRFFHRSQVGIVHCRSRSSPASSHGMPILRPHGHGFKDDGFYIIAALVRKMLPGYYYDLHTYDSRTDEWATRTAFFLPQAEQDQEQQKQYHRRSTKVIVVGGKSGTIGWADLWRGILFCDILRLHLQDQAEDVQLRYVALPPPIRELSSDWLAGCPRRVRDIALVKDRIKYVELHTHIRPGSEVDGNYIADDWTVATWFIKTTAKSLDKGSWQPSYKVSASQILPEKNPLQFQMLPELLDDQGRPQPTLQRLHTEHPTLSLHEGNTVYLMTKRHYIKDTEGWAIAVDLRKKALQGVAQFDAQRMFPATFTYMCCGISKHLQLAPVTMVDLKRSGTPMRQSSLKKQAGIRLFDFQDSHRAQKNEDDEVKPVSVEDLDQDNMDLE